VNDTGTKKGSIMK